MLRFIKVNFKGGKTSPQQNNTRGPKMGPVTILIYEVNTLNIKLNCGFKNKNNL